MASNYLEALKYLATHRVAIFDVDDTLVATFDVAFARTCAALERMNLESIDKESFTEVYGIVPFPHCIHRWHPELDLPAFQNVYKNCSVSIPYRPFTSLP